jgi:hypothetical protein
MELDLDTFLVTVYCVIDDLYHETFAAHKPGRPGAEPEMSDSEVLTVVVLTQWQPSRSESAFLGYVRQHWRAYFPRVLSQSAFNRRARDLMGVLCALGPVISQRLDQALGSAPPYEVLDTVPVPLMRRCRGDRHHLFGLEAALGQGGSDQDWYYGVALLGAITSRGLIAGFVLGPANTQERWLAEALLRWRQAPTAAPPSAADLLPVLGPSHKRGGRRGPTGPLAPRQGVGTVNGAPYVADLGFAGQAWQQHWAQDYGARVLTKADYAQGAAPADPQAAARWVASLRQVVETVFYTLSARFGLTFPRARTYWGLLTRLSAKIAAFNLAVYVNHLFNRPVFAIFDPLG